MKHTSIDRKLKLIELSNQFSREGLHACSMPSTPSPNPSRTLPQCIINLVCLLLSIPLPISSHSSFSFSLHLPPSPYPLQFDTPQHWIEGCRSSRWTFGYLFLSIEKCPLFSLKEVITWWLVGVNLCCAKGFTYFSVLPPHSTADFTLWGNKKFLNKLV